MSSRIPKPPSRIPGIPVFNKKPLVENNKENVPAVAGPSKPTVEAKKAAPSKATTLKAPITKPRRSVRTVALKSASVATGRVTKVVIRKSNKFNKAPTTSTRAAIAKTVKPTTAAARAPVKRTATTTAKTETAAKVAKVMKPAPYDFKARFTQLLEKHKELKEQFSTYEEGIPKVYHCIPNAVISLYFELFKTDTFHNQTKYDTHNNSPVVVYCRYFYLI